MFLALLAAIGLALGRVRNLGALDRMLDRLEDRSAQLRVRAALTLALAFAVLASRFGFASILGAFAAGLLVRTIDLTGRAPHPQFQAKLEGIGFGFLVPVFFITTGAQFDARALVSNPDRDRRDTAVPGRPAGGPRRPRPCLRPPVRQATRRGGRADAGHLADLRDRSDPDRHRLRADQPDHRRRAARRRTAVRRALPRRRAQAAPRPRTTRRGPSWPASGSATTPIRVPKAETPPTGRGPPAHSSSAAVGGHAPALFPVTGAGTGPAVPRCQLNICFLTF